MTGILCLYKPEEKSSFWAVKKVRYEAGEKKAGHCGTLDPMATGVLPVMLGGATRFLEFLPTTPKRYTATLKLGVRTDTLDATGTVLEEHEVTAGREEIKNALVRFRGEITQVPPMYSALKKDGVRLYDLARKGVEVEREARPVTIFALTLMPDGTLGTDPALGEYVLDVTCSGGTYIRTLIDDLGAALGCGAMMTALERTQVGVFTKENALTVPELERAAENGTLEEYLLPVGDALSQYPAVLVTAPQAKRFSNGGGLDLVRLHSLKEQPEDGALLRVYHEERFLGLGETSLTAGELSVKRVFVDR